MKKAIIIGSNGQDGQLLYNLLEKKDYQIIGITRNGIKTTHPTTLTNINLFNPNDIHQLIEQTQARELYYLAAIHHSSEETKQSETELFTQSLQTHVTGLQNCLEAIRQHSPKTKLIYAASSHIFGQPTEPKQTENTPLNPIDIYGITKATGLQLCKYYRQHHNLFASVGILYNHESHLRHRKFVSQKIIKTALDIKYNHQKKLTLGDITTKVDWGYAKDYVKAMHAILNNTTQPDDFIIATGEQHTIKEFVEIVFKELSLDWEKYVEKKPNLLKKQQANLCGNNTKLKKATGWQPTIDFKTMVKKLLTQAQKNYETPQTIC